MRRKWLTYQNPTIQTYSHLFSSSNTFSGSLFFLSDKRWIMWWLLYHLYILYFSIFRLTFWDVTLAYLINKYTTLINSTKAKQTNYIKGKGRSRGYHFMNCKLRSLIFSELEALKCWLDSDENDMCAPF